MISYCGSPPSPLSSDKVAMWISGEPFCLITAAWKSPVSALIPSVCCATELHKDPLPFHSELLCHPHLPVWLQKFKHCVHWVGSLSSQRSDSQHLLFPKVQLPANRLHHRYNSNQVRLSEENGSFFHCFIATQILQFFGLFFLIQATENVNANFKIEQR